MPAPPAALVALVENFECAHCTTPAPPDLRYDEATDVWRIVLLHDQECPVYTGAIDGAPNISRAINAASPRATLTTGEPVNDNTPEDTPPPIPPHVLEYIDSYRDAVALARIVTLADLPAFTSMWTSLTTLEQTNAFVCLARLLGQTLADCLVLAGHHEINTVTGTDVAKHLGAYLQHLATASGEQPNTTPEN